MGFTGALGARMRAVPPSCGLLIAFRDVRKMWGKVSGPWSNLRARAAYNIRQPNLFNCFAESVRVASAQRIFGQDALRSDRKI